MEEANTLEAPSRYIVGIDLGTTNSAVSFIDTKGQPGKLQTLSLLQMVAPDTAESLNTLPSFHYVPAADEFGQAALQLPWETMPDDPIIGTLAREHGRQNPGRLVASAKSWLSHAGVDRTAALLPWQGAGDVEKRSPVAVSARYLGHMRAAWNHQFPNDPLEQQDLIVGVPASFDEVARELTVGAAQQAGLPRLVLLEEPQAAFYSWLQRQGEDWHQTLKPGETVLICDVGGGTTDFTLIQVRQQKNELPRLHRIAVGDHLILGGDNLDLALARSLEEKLSPNGSLEPPQWSALVRRCQQAKEALLGPQPPAHLTLHLPGAGARLLGGALQVELSREDALALLVDGFLPRTAYNEPPARHGSGFREFGLPFAADAGISRYLSEFLRLHRDTAAAERPDHPQPERPDKILLNGGFFASPDLSQRLLEVLHSWFNADEDPADTAWTPAVLENPDLGLAVAQGAAYYGQVRRGAGERIQAGLARTYYIGVGHQAAAEAALETTDGAALCLLPAGIEAGQSVELTDRAFELLIRQPVEFPIYTSGFVTTDRPGDLVAFDPERLASLPPIRTVLSAGKRAKAATVQVRLHAQLTEIGTLELWCAEVHGERTWKLQFDVRAATQTEVEGHQGQAEAGGFIDEQTNQRCQAIVAAAFGGKEEGGAVVKALEAATEIGRDEWPPSLLRALWEELLKREDGRQRQAQTEARWLNLTGFCLRPGFGFALDDWRVGQVWRRLAQAKPAFHRNEQCRAEWWILWRRLAGGLSPTQQQTLAEPLLSNVRAAAKGQKHILVEKTGSHEIAEIARLLASLEHLNVETKVYLGNRAVDAIQVRGSEAWNRAALWALGRLGARQPVYCLLNNLVESDQAEHWLAALLPLEQATPALTFAAVQLARRTHDRFRDISEQARQQTIDALKRWRAADHYIELVEAGGALSGEEQRSAFGDSLPPGLMLV